MGWAVRPSPPTIPFNPRAARPGRRVSRNRTSHGPGAAPPEAEACREPEPDSGLHAAPPGVPLGPEGGSLPGPVRPPGAPRRGSSRAGHSAARRSSDGRLRPGPAGLYSGELTRSALEGCATCSGPRCLLF